MSALHDFHSPLTLLREWRDRADGAPLREVLIMGYTLDLVFLERYCVPIARGLGARVTVVGDAGQAVHAAVDVRYAGRSYQHGHASCRGAFHPKLVVLLGDEDVRIAVGSGNPTMSGWGHNHELWLVLRSKRQRGSQAQRDLAEWLAELPKFVAMPSWIAETVRFVGQVVNPAELTDDPMGLRIFGNLRHSLLGRLPNEPIRSVRMTAPFFDARAEAVRAVVRRMRPDEVRVAVQPHLSSYDGQRLVDATSAVPMVRFDHLPEDRTSHGKLVEWETDSDTTVAMTGSANLSAAAMLSTTENGGNCELVTICPVQASLLPEGVAAPVTTIHASNTLTTTPGGKLVSLTLLGARRLPDVMVIELLTSARTPITIETSPDGGPGAWTPVHVLSSDTDAVITARFAVPEQLGGSVRAFTVVDGERIVSDVVFLTDTARCLPRDEKPDLPKLTRDYDLDEVFTDTRLADRFNNDLVRLLGQVRERQVTGSVPLRKTGSAPEVADDDRWGHWLQEVERTLGPALTRVVFPGALQLPVDEGTGWSFSSDTDDTELAEDEDAEALDDVVEVRSMVVPPTQRQRCRTWARSWVKAVSTEPRPPMFLRMTVARIYLNLLAAGVWGTDEEWRAELGRLVRALVPTDDEDRNSSGRELDFLNSLIAVCLALLLQDASLHGGTPRDLIARDAWTGASDWAAYADSQIIADYLYQPDQAHARIATESEVEEVVTLAQAAADDPTAVLYDVFEKEGLQVERTDGVWVVEDSRRTLRRVAARVAELVSTDCVVLARNTRGACVIIRVGNTVAVAESTIPRWRIYQLTPLSSPQSLLASEDGLPATRNNHPLAPVPRQVDDLTNQLGVTSAHLVAALHAAK
jgi:hypothetical protein